MNSNSLWKDKTFFLWKSKYLSGGQFFALWLSAISFKTNYSLNIRNLWTRNFIYISLFKDIYDFKKNYKFILFLGDFLFKGLNLW